MKKKTIVILSALLVLSGIIAYWLTARNKYKPPEWKTAKVDTGSIAVNITATGTLSAVTTVQVGAQVSGIVAKILVDYDSVVKKGQVIAVLDTVLLHAAMLDAKATVEKCRAQVELMRRQFVRMDTLFHEKVAAQADYDQAYANYAAAKADLEAATATLQHEMINLQYATIKAPINGTVISRNVDVGQTVISSFNAPTLFSIAKDLKQMQVLADVDEADIGQVRVGQKTDFTVDAYPYEVFHGDVAQIRLQPVMIQNVNNYIVVINVANPELKLLPGLTATTTIMTQQHSNILKIPVAAVHFMPSADYINHIAFDHDAYNKTLSKKIAGNEIPKPGTECYIWLKKGTSIGPVLVKVGLFDGTDIEVRGAIKPADEVITGSNVQSTAGPVANNPFMPKMTQPNKKK